MPNSYITKADGLLYLAEYLKPGATVYTVLRHVSASGMSRRISCFVMLKASKGKPAAPYCIDHLVAAVTGYRLAPRGEGLKVGGAGMDMGFHLVYTLGCAFWPNGTRRPHGTRNGAPDRDGGYALKQRWL